MRAKLSWRVWLLACVLLSACKTPTPEQDAPPPASSAPLPPAPAPSPTPSAPKKREEPVQPLQVLRFAFASEIKAKEPTDHLEVAEPGKRIYAHMAFKNTNPEPRQVHVTFRVNGERRTTLDLKVDSSQSYRTWAFNTLKDSDRSGQLTLEVTDESGQTLLSEKLPIKPRKGKLAPCSPAIALLRRSPPRTSTPESAPLPRPHGSSYGARGAPSPEGCSP